MTTASLRSTPWLNQVVMITEPVSKLEEGSGRNGGVVARTRVRLAGGCPGIRRIRGGLSNESSLARIRRRGHRFAILFLRKRLPAVSLGRSDCTGNEFRIGVVA